MVSETAKQLLPLHTKKPEYNLLACNGFRDSKAITAPSPKSLC